VPPRSERALPEELQRLVASHVSSFERLEVLALLARRRADVWEADQIATELRLPARLVRGACDGLLSGGILERDPQGRYRYAPSVPAMAIDCDALCAQYQADPIQIITAISALAFERLRSSAARAFADAFRIRKPDDEER
jgi:hypothetical protein